MPARNNVHVPSESWPFFSWYVIEFAIVISIAVVIGWQTSPLLRILLLCMVGNVSKYHK